MPRRPDLPRPMFEPQVKKAEQLAKDLGNFVNCMSHNEWSVFIDTLALEHRTLQQSATGLMLLWFKHLSELDDNYYDLRNEHAVRIAKKIRAVLEDEYGSAWCHMPLI